MDSKRIVQSEVSAEKASKIFSHYNESHWSVFMTDELFCLVSSICIPLLRIQKRAVISLISQ